MSWSHSGSVRPVCRGEGGQVEGGGRRWVAAPALGPQPARIRCDATFRGGVEWIWADRALLRGLVSPGFVGSAPRYGDGGNKGQSLPEPLPSQVQVGTSIPARASGLQGHARPRRGLNRPLSQTDWRAVWSLRPKAGSLERGTQLLLCELGRTSRDATRGSCGFPGLKMRQWLTGGGCRISSRFSSSARYECIAVPVSLHDTPRPTENSGWRGMDPELNEVEQAVRTVLGAGVFPAVGRFTQTTHIL